MKYALPPLLLSLGLLALSYVFTWQHRLMLAAMAFALSAVFAAFGKELSDKATTSQS